jgi:hypothetical protein
MVALVKLPISGSNAFFHRSSVVDKIVNGTDSRFACLGSVDSEITKESFLFLISLHK